MFVPVLSKLASHAPPWPSVVGVFVMWLTFVQPVTGPEHVPASKLSEKSVDDDAVLTVLESLSGETLPEVSRARIAYVYTVDGLTCVSVNVVPVPLVDPTS